MQGFIVFFKQEQLLNVCDADYCLACKPLVRFQINESCSGASVRKSSILQVKK